MLISKAKKLHEISWNSIFERAYTKWGYTYSVYEYIPCCIRMSALEFILYKSKMSNFNVISSCCFSTSRSISRLLSSIYPSIENTYTNLVRRLSLKFTTSSDVALVETNSDSRLGNHCMYDERGGVISNLYSERLSTTSPPFPPQWKKVK